MDHLRCLAFLDLPHRPYYLAISPDGRAIVACSQEGIITRLSSSLEVLGSLDLRSGVDGIALSPDGEHLGLALRDRTCVITGQGEVVTAAPHKPWPDCAGGGCAFSPHGGYFWSVRPGGEGREVSVRVTACEGWRPVAEEEFKADEDGYWSIVPHPEGDVVGLWLGAGQDGQWLYWCGLQDDWLYVEEEAALAWAGPPVFHPAGGEFLTDSLEDGLLRRHRFPDGEVIGQVAEADLFPADGPEEGPERFGGGPLYLSDRRALVLSSNGRIRLLDLEAMRVEGEIALEGHPLKARRFAREEREHLYGDVEQLSFAEGGPLVTGHRGWIDRTLNPDHGLGVWDAAPLCEPMRGPAAWRPFTGAFFDHFLR